MTIQIKILQCYRPSSSLLLVMVLALFVNSFFAGGLISAQETNSDDGDETLVLEPEREVKLFTTTTTTTTVEPITIDSIVLMNINDNEGLQKPSSPMSTTTATTITHCNTGDLFGFDLAFVNASHHQLVPIYENNNVYNNDDDYACDIDTLLDHVLPPNYEVAQNFRLTNEINVQHINQTFAKLHQLRQLVANYSNIWTPVLQRVMTKFSFLLYEIQLSPQCAASMVSLMTAMNRNELWALKFMDASGRLPSGLLDGVLSSVGDYEECLNIRSSIASTPDSAAKQQFTGQYCLVKPVIPHPPRHSYHKGDTVEHSFGLPFSLMDEIVDFLYLFNGTFVNFGLCMPSTCDADEVENAINTILYPITGIPIQVGPHCTTQQSRNTLKLDIYQIIAVYTLGSLFALTLFASMFEYCCTWCSQVKGDDDGTKQNKLTTSEVTIKIGDINNNNNSNGDMLAMPSTPEKKITTNGKSNSNTKVSSLSSSSPRPSLVYRLIVSFSLVRNTKQMFVVSPNKFASVDFLRFLMLCQIILMHQYYVALGWSAWPLTKRIFNGLMQKAGTEFKYAFLRNIHNTDFFFALSGLLLTYSTMRNLERNNGRFNYFSFALNMYLRFYPAVFGTILLFYLLPLFGDGPFWHLVDSYHVQACRTNLMSSMLTYNLYELELENFVQHSMCNVASWWVNSCFHLILLSPLLLLPLFYSSHALWLVGLTIVGGSTLSIGHIWYKGIPFMNQLALMNSIFEESFYSLYYTWPFIHHIAPFCLGIMIGYIIRRYPNIYLGGKFGETLLTVVFVGLSCFGFYWTQDMLKSSSDVTALLDVNSVTPNYEIYLNVTIGKLMFCAGFMWIFYLCCTNRSVFLNNLFTWPGLQPLYSLSLGFYLTNFIPALFTTFSTSDMVEFTDLQILKNASFNFSLTVVLSYIIHVLFERPIMNILKIIESG